MNHNDLFLNLKNHILPNSDHDAIIFGNNKNQFGEANTLLQTLECYYFPEKNVLQGIINDYNMKLRGFDKGISVKVSNSSKFIGNSVNVNEDNRYSTFKIKANVASTTRNRNYSYNDTVELCVHENGIIVNGQHDVCTKTLDNISGKLFTNKIYNFNMSNIEHIRKYSVGTEDVYNFFVIVIYNNSDIIQSLRIYDIEYNFAFEDVTDLFQNRQSMLYNSFLHEVKETNEFIRRTENYYSLES